MSTSDAAAGAPAAPIIDGKFAKRFVTVCAAVPGLLLAWDAARGQLGVNEVNFAIRTTGLLGLLFLTAALLVTPLRRLTGWNQLIAVRRNLGLYGFFYIVSHFAIFFLYDRDGSVASTLEEIVSRAYLWFGTAALVFMVPLAITSTDGMVTRLGARRWKLLHRLSYAAAIGGIIHYYLLVKADVTQPLAFAVVVAVLLAYRIARHYLDLRVEVGATRARLASAKAGDAASRKRRFWSGQLVVARIFQETPDVKTFRLALPGGGPLPFEHVAGQYLNLALTIDGRRVNRSYTIASSPTRSAYCEITVKRLADGRASRHLHDTWREGSIVHVSAPAGKFVFAGDEARRVVLLAGGVGITPMMSVVRSLTDRSWTGDIYLLFSVRERRDLIFEDELAHLERRFPNLHVCVTLSDSPGAGWDGARGRISRELVEAFVPELKRGPILLCGPTPMMIAMRALLVEMGVPDAEILEEAFVSPPSPPMEDVAADEPAAAPAFAPVANGEPRSVRFQRAGKTAELGDDLTVLEAAEEAGISIPFECRSGICGQCKTKLVSGDVTMLVQDALTPGDKAKRLILACQARAIRDVVVDA
jgi:ferredoxin-NADP reductase/DMSO/TMAO reductase YedYZ heme-binding membrane subunit